MKLQKREKKEAYTRVAKGPQVPGPGKNGWRMMEKGDITDGKETVEGENLNNRVPRCGE